MEPKQNKPTLYVWLLSMEKDSYFAEELYYV